MNVTVTQGDTRVQRYLSELADPTAWDAAELESRRSEWELALTPEQSAELEAALTAAVARLGHWDHGAPVEAWRDELSSVAPIFGVAEHSVEGGAGICLVRNLPVRTAQSEVLFNEDLIWGVGSIFGRHVNQNGRGQLLAHVRDLGDPHRGRDVRPEDTNDPLRHHTDGSDLILLMCVRQAVKGGNSFISSSVRTVQTIARQRPDLLATLLEEPFAFDRNEEQPPGDPSFYLTRLCVVVANKISVRYSREMIETAQHAPGAPQLSAKQRELLDVFDEVSAEGGAEVDFRSGDLMIMNNYTVLHARSPFEDVADIDGRRLLLRTWTAMWNGRPLPFDFDRGINTDGTARGGVPLTTTAKEPVAV